MQRRSREMPVGGTRVRVSSVTPAPRGTTRRWLLGAGTAGVVAGVSASGGLLTACGVAPGGSGGGDESKTASRAPVTIDILTRSGVAAQTGHSQWYAQVAKNTFTPQTNIPVNL